MDTILSIARCERVTGALREGNISDLIKKSTLIFYCFLGALFHPLRLAALLYRPPTTLSSRDSHVLTDMRRSFNFFILAT